MGKHKLKHVNKIFLGGKSEENTNKTPPWCRLRMCPHNVPESSRVEMMAECPIDHPFFVKDKG